MFKGNEIEDVILYVFGKYKNKIFIGEVVEGDVENI